MAKMCKVMQTQARVLYKMSLIHNTKQVQKLAEHIRSCQDVLQLQGTAKKKMSWHMLEKWEALREQKAVDGGFLSF